MSLPYNKVGAVVGGHVRNGYDVDELKKLLENGGFKIEKIKFIGNLFGGIAWFLSGILYKTKFLNFLLFPFFLGLSKLDKILPLQINKEILLVSCTKN